MRKTLLLSCFTLFVFPLIGQKKFNVIEIKTNYGTMYVWLYKDTPIHSKNFLKLAQANFFDSTTFHRVINNFMIQGGDPFSKNPAKKDSIGEGGPGYELKAEFGHTHKKGVIAAARNPEMVNPEQKSSGSQFYIVQGKKCVDAEIDHAQNRINGWKKDAMFYIVLHKKENKADLDRYMKFVMQNKIDSVNAIRLKYKRQEDSLWALQKEFVFTDAQREIYKTLGGTPHLDNNYTAFGEVIKGIEVVDKIAAVSTSGLPLSRPLTPVLMDVNVLTFKKKAFIKMFGIDPLKLP